MIEIHSTSTKFSALDRALRRGAGQLKLLAGALLATCALSAVAACPLEAPKLRVTDPAGVLGDKAGALAGKLARYQAATGHQLAVLLTPSLEGSMSVEECAVAMFKQWQLGRKGIDDGVLLLVAVNERKMRIEVGYGLEGTLTDARSSRIIHEVMRPLLARGEYAEGIDRAVDAIIESIGTEAQRAPSKRPERASQHAAEESHNKAVAGSVLLIFMLPSLIMGGLGLLIFGIPGSAYAFWVFPDWRGCLFAALIITAWCALRWRLIGTNVRKFHLKKSGNHTLTWIWYFMALGAAQRAPRRKSTRRRKSTSDDESFSFVSSSDSDSSSECGSSSSSSGNDSGGESGGGGASGDY